MRLAERAGAQEAADAAAARAVHLQDVHRAALEQPALVRRLAGLLPGDVRVWRARAVPETFDARFSALWRRYEYRVCDAEPGPDPLRRRDTLHWLRPLDLDRMNAAAAGLCGEHDFAAFCKRKEHATTIRHITAMSWRREPDGTLVATVQADAFCQAMVRSLVGAMLSAGDGRREPGWPASLLTRHERSSDVVVAPPHGLNLVAVGYPDEAEFAARADQTRNLRGVPAGLARAVRQA